MTASQFTTWRTSSYSAGNGGECVEVAHAPADIAVRDSKHPTTGNLTLTTHTWTSLTSTLTARTP